MRAFCHKQARAVEQHVDLSAPVLQFHKRCQGLVKLCSGHGVLALPRQADCQIRGSECNVTRFADLT